MIYDRKTLINIWKEGSGVSVVDFEMIAAQSFIQPPSQPNQMPLQVVWLPQEDKEREESWEKT